MITQLTIFDEVPAVPMPALVPCETSLCPSRWRNDVFSTLLIYGSHRCTVCARIMLRGSYGFSEVTEALAASGYPDYDLRKLSEGPLQSMRRRILDRRRSGGSMSMY